MNLSLIKKGIKQGLLWDLIEEPKRLYRYEDRAYGSIFDGDYSTSYTVKIELLECEVIKRTKKGVWIQSVYGGKDHFVLLYAKKKFAYATKEEALESFLRRKKCQIKILKNKLSQAEMALYIAETDLKEQVTTQPSELIME